MNIDERAIILRKGRVLRSRLLVTGQLTQYGGFADDGFYKRGFPRSLQVLSSGAYSGTTDITINSKTDTHSNNCVLSNATGLMWSRYAAGSVGPASNGLLPWTTTGSGATAEGIFAYCDAANAAALAGFTDWRVPNAIELTCIAKFEAPSGVPDSTAFPSWPAVVFWSSTTVPGLTTSACTFDYFYGTGSNAVKTTNHAVILVRGG
jgi:hypothetical protein